MIERMENLGRGGYDLVVGWNAIRAERLRLSTLCYNCFGNFGLLHDEEIVVFLAALYEDVFAVEQYLF